jgi:hypothetical protein
MCHANHCADCGNFQQILEVHCAAKDRAFNSTSAFLSMQLTLRCLVWHLQALGRNGVFPSTNDWQGAVTLKASRAGTVINAKIAGACDAIYKASAGLTRPVNAGGLAKLSPLVMMLTLPHSCWATCCSPGLCKAACSAVPRALPVYC